MAQPAYSTQELHPAKGRIGQHHHLVAGGDLLWHSAKQLEGQCSGRSASLPPPRAKAPGQPPAIQLQVENHQLQPPLVVEDANQTSEPLERAPRTTRRSSPGASDRDDDGLQDRPPSRFVCGVLEQHLQNLARRRVRNNGTSGPIVEVEETAEGAWGLALGTFSGRAMPLAWRKSASMVLREARWWTLGMSSSRS